MIITSLIIKLFYLLISYHQLYGNECVLEPLNLYSTDLLITGTQYQKSPQIILSKELFNELNDLVAKGKFSESKLYELKASTYKKFEEKVFDREEKLLFFYDLFLI